MRYEDLLTGTEETLIKVCAFLELEYHQGMIHYYEATEEKNREPGATLEWKMKTLEKPDPSKIGRFRKDLSPEQIATFNQLAGKQLTEYGYDL